MTYPDMTKKMSTPKYPLGRISLLKWLIITAITANALRPSISNLYCSFKTQTISIYIFSFLDFFFKCLFLFTIKTYRLFIPFKETANLCFYQILIKQCLSRSSQCSLSTKILWKKWERTEWRILKWIKKWRKKYIPINIAWFVDW